MTLVFAPDDDQFDRGLLNALILAAPFWAAVIYLIWRWQS